ncbi:MAG: phage tail assembly chaperone [Bacteroidota bacterium]|nr:phage tail assembly chaperone [Bacteroidota bacterium]
MTKYKLVDGVKVEMSPSEIQEVENRTKLIEKTDDDFTMLRIERNRLLTETDWIVIREREQAGSVHNFEAFMKYRQELRDIPTKYNKVSLVKWPTKPEIDLG